MSCPFYGNAMIMIQHGTFSPSLMPSGGNQCALITSSHSPCYMDAIELRIPDWKRCPRNPEFMATAKGKADATARCIAELNWLRQIEQVRI